jgi:hypothetical protein
MWVVLEISRQPNYHSFLGYMELSTPFSSTCTAATSLANSDEVTIPHFLIILLWFKVMLCSLPCALAFLTFAPIVRPIPAPQARVWSIPFHFFPFFRSSIFSRNLELHGLHNFVRQNSALQHRQSRVRHACATAILGP